jgi:small conductance mechanosensitive channel
MLLAFKPFKAGDYIEAQGFAGIVKSINIVSTKLVTLDNREVILPNGALSNGTINNYSANPLRRIDLTVNVSYGSDAETVKTELMRIVSENEKVLDAETPGAQDPTVVLSDLKESSVEFLVRVWVRSSDIREVRYALTESIYKGLPAHGVSFPFPQLDIHLKHS